MLVVMQILYCSIIGIKILLICMLWLIYSIVFDSQFMESNIVVWWLFMIPFDNKRTGIGTTWCAFFKGFPFLCLLGFSFFNFYLILNCLLQHQTFANNWISMLGILSQPVTAYSILASRSVCLFGEAWVSEADVVKEGQLKDEEEKRSGRKRWRWRGGGEWKDEKEIEMNKITWNLWS